MNTDGKNDVCLFMEQKASLIEEYLSISEAMNEALALGKDAEIECFVSERQTCMNNIKKIDRSLEKRIKTEKDELSGISSDFKDAFSGHIGHIKTLLEKIAAIDADVIGMVKEENRGIKAELLKISNARQAAKGYGTKGKYSPKYLDAKR